jgi:hypothetical protein
MSASPFYPRLFNPSIGSGIFPCHLPVVMPEKPMKSQYLKSKNNQNDIP